MMQTSSPMSNTALSVTPARKSSLRMSSTSAPVDSSVVDTIRPLKAGQRTDELPTYERVKNVTSTRITNINGGLFHKQTTSFDLNELTTVDEKRETGSVIRTIKRLQNPPYHTLVISL